MWAALEQDAPVNDWFRWNCSQGRLCGDWRACVVILCPPAWQVPSSRGRCSVMGGSRLSPGHFWKIVELDYKAGSHPGWEAMDGAISGHSCFWRHLCSGADGCFDIWDFQLQDCPFQLQASDASAGMAHMDTVAELWWPKDVKSLLPRMEWSIQNCSLILMTLPGSTTLSDYQEQKKGNSSVKKRRSVVQHFPHGSLISRTYCVQRRQNFVKVWLRIC